VAFDDGDERTGATELREAEDDRVRWAALVIAELEGDGLSREDVA
jgi:hypothetical protein